jgi:hypothetical protein
MSAPSNPLVSPAASPSSRAPRVRPRRFIFAQDTFAFPNELVWEYRFDAVTGKTSFARREPKPSYAHRCFVLTRAARQFLYHARFDATLPVTEPGTYRRLIRAVLARNPRAACAPEQQVLIPGYAGLRAFSQAQESLLKSECGGAWRSYVLRSHWRMVFPISRSHQARTAAELATEIGQAQSPIIHLVRFPELTINHGMVLFDAAITPARMEFQAYDPNDPRQPTRLTFDPSARRFLLPANTYWAGGWVNVIPIYRTWLM